MLRTHSMTLTLPHLQYTSKLTNIHSLLITLSILQHDNDQDIVFILTKCGADQIKNFQNGDN